MQAVAVTGFDQVVFGNPLGCDRKDGLWARIYGRWFKISSNRLPIAPDFPISPALINQTHFTGVFGRMECETFAALLVKYAQNKGAWSPMTLEELVAFHNSAFSAFDGENLSFFVELGFLEEKDGRFSYTQGFVTEVLEAQ